MDHKDDNPIVTRFAPSPTGFLHVGTARTALFAYLFARKNNGQFILRIEDTDKKREVKGAVSHIEESLRWLGLDWDFGPDKPGPFGSCFQSERLDIYRKYALKLIEQGLAYPDPYTPDEVERFRNEAKAQGEPFLFRNYRPQETETWDGNKPLRFKVPEIKRYTWQDAVRGELSAGEEMLDDIIIIKADGFPTYNFAHIIDDFEMGVTHVMRGEEFIASTPKYLSLYEALKIKPPVFVTLPPIMAADGKKKLSKRDGAKDLLAYREEGYLPEAMRNFLALIGWNPGTDEEILPSDPDNNILLEKFSLAGIQKSGGAFDEKKLDWMNKEYLNRQTESFKLNYLKTALRTFIAKWSDYQEEKLKRLSPVIFERIHNQKEIKEAAASGGYDWAFSEIDYPTELLHWKKDPDVTAALPRLNKLKELLNDADFSTPDTIKDAVWSYAEEAGKGEVLWPLRVALSGRERSPDPFTLAFVLGKTATLARIEAACGKIKG